MSTAENGTPLNVFCITEFVGEDRKKHRRWLRVGVAFRHREGDGMNLVLDALPLNGRLIVLPRDDDVDDGPGAAGEQKQMPLQKC